MPTVDYREWLPELKTTTLFQDIADDDLIALLEAMAPQVIHIEVGQYLPLDISRNFAMFLRRYPPKEQVPRRFKWDMPKFEEPGMLMGEIPYLSRYLEREGQFKRPPMRDRPRETACDILLFDVNTILDYRGDAVFSAQKTMLRNLLGILAQKVTDVREELWKLKYDVDIHNMKEGDWEKLRR